jgi:hypothetical protein
VFEFPQRELINIITKNFITPSDADLLQAMKAIRSQRANYVQDTGSVNTLSVALDPPLTAYTVGLPIKVKVANTCTGASTIDAGAGRVAIKLMNGGGTAAGDLPAGGVCELVYDGSAFQLVNFLGSGGGAGTGTEFLIKIPYTVDSSATPNIVIANFSPAITTLTAGDPLLVKIANTCTGASVLRVNGLADKAIRANGGGTSPLLQGDLAVGDVVLFLYDGTNFWIQPNPIISANTTLSVPSAYATVDAALLAIRRKTIAQNATLTVQIATSVIAPFSVNHANADRIIIKGTMLTAGNLTSGNFAQTGSSSGARAADSANNIAMLRTKFGTEVQVPGNPAFTAGIENVGPGTPTIQDILVTGPNAYSGDAVARWIGVTVRNNRLIKTFNVSCWGLDCGYYGGGTIIGSYTHASGCFRYGALATTGAVFAFDHSGMFGGSLNGFYCNQNSWLGCDHGWSNFNGNVGIGCSDAAQATSLTSQHSGNVSADVAAGPLSYMLVLDSTAGGGFSTSSPTANGPMSAFGAVVVSA